MRLFIAVTALLLIGTAVGSPSEGWPLNAGDADGTRYSHLTQINAENVGQLGLAWEFRDFVVRGRTHHGMESNPILAGDTLYVSGPWGTAYALDARTGRLRWQFDPKADGQYARNTCCDVVSRGLAVSDG
ncbi:MAG TPA: PQQ-binding-like beta-propeller repeat protein, partial [Steroidobacteraceae bacterium]|nr:PQQ-binding-like beta-propeller repeat protein [Steroidobacteraceae bacterium]